MIRLPRRISLVAAMGGITAIAMGLAMFAQHCTADRRERALKSRLGEAIRYRYSRDHMDRFLGDLGRIILNQVDRGERLVVSREGQVTPAGVPVDAKTLRHIAAHLLDPSNYGYFNSGDDPEPRSGVRLTRGADTLDILFDATTPGHVDVWATIRDGSGRVVHGPSQMCVNDKGLLEVVNASGF